MAKQCRQCGAWAEDMDKFCQQCGSALASAIVEEAPEVVEAEIILPTKRYHNPAADAREVRERLIGEKAEYYLPRFEKMETLNSYISWNWAAFIFGSFWMLYRKMYAFCIAAMAASFFVGTVDSALLNLLLSIAFGVFGNYLYMRDIDKRTQKALDLQPEEREEYIQQYSGTSQKAVWIVLAIWVIVNMIFS